jgi:DNA-binding MarR family transcriptional regulator
MANMNARPDPDQKHMTEQAQALLAVLQAAMTSISATESALRDKGFALRASEWDLMAFLQDFGPMRPAELLRLCILTTNAATLSTILSRLEKRGLVVRVPDETDARSVIVDVTREGRQLVNEIWPMLSVKVVAPFNAHFTEEERARLLELMGRI